VKPAATSEREVGAGVDAFVGVSCWRTDDDEVGAFLSRKVQVSGTTIRT
jgi:hypothetical protein